MGIVAQRQRLSAIARINMSQYQTGGSHSFGLVQSPRSDAAPYSGTDKTHLGPRLITSDHYQQTQTRVTSAQFVSDRIPESDVIVSPRSSATNRQAESEMPSDHEQRRSNESGEMVSPRSRVNREQPEFQMSSELRAEVQAAAAHVHNHYVEESQQVNTHYVEESHHNIIKRSDK